MHKLDWRRLPWHFFLNLFFHFLPVLYLLCIMISHWLTVLKHKMPNQILYKNSWIGLVDVVHLWTHDFMRNLQLGVDMLNVSNCGHQSCHCDKTRPINAARWPARFEEWWPRWIAPPCYQYWHRQSFLVIFWHKPCYSHLSVSGPTLVTLDTGGGNHYFWCGAAEFNISVNWQTEENRG